MPRSSSRSSSSSSLTSIGPRNLTLIQFHGERGGCEQHWGLFLPLEDGMPQGKLGHIRVNKDRKRRVLGCNPYVEDFSPRDTKSPFYAFPIPGTSVRTSDLNQAVHEVYATFFSGTVRNPNSPQYHMAKNNCQHFCYLVLRNLHWKYPLHVDIVAINFVESSSTPLLAISNLIRSLRGKEGPYPKPYFEEGFWWRFNPRSQIMEYSRGDGTWREPVSQQPPRRRMLIE